MYSTWNIISNAIDETGNITDEFNSIEEIHFDKFEIDQERITINHD